MAQLLLSQLRDFHALWCALVTLVWFVAATLGAGRLGSSSAPCQLDPGVFLLWGGRLWT